MLFSIQYLRGLASIFVLIYHAFHKNNQISDSGINFSFGASGVDLFFIISGYIMCHVTAHKNITARDFFLARLVRILPLYWCLSILAAIIYAINPRLVNSSGGSTTIINSFTLIPTGEKFLIQNGWTLSYEFFFYLIYAVSIAIWCRKRLHVTSAIIAALVASGITLMPASPMLKFTTNKILLEFLMGISAYAYLNSKHKNSKTNASLIFLGVSTLTVASLSPHPTKNVIWYGLPYACLFSGIVGFEHFIKLISTSFLGHTMKSIGDASYSIYLSHPFVLSVASVILKRLDLSCRPEFFVPITTMVSIIVGHFCYVILEKRLNHFAKKIIAPSAIMPGSATGQP
jgi:exopolysaccharide production protein ExoZ